MASVQERINKLINGTSAANSYPVETHTSSGLSVQERINKLIGDEGGASTSLAPAAEAKPEAKEEPSFWDKLMSNLGFAGEKGVAGAAEGTEGFVNFAGYTGQMAQRGQDTINAGYTKALGDLFGIDKLQRVGEQEQAEAKANATREVETVANFGDRYAAKVEEKYADAPIGKVGRFAGDVAEGLGGMLPAVAANIIAPGSGLAVMTTGAIGNATQEAKKNGADDATAMAYGLAVGGVEAVTEKFLGGMGGLFGKGALDDAAKGFINNRVKNGVVRGELNTVISAFGEGVEEFLSEYGQSLANRLTIKTENRNWGEVSKDALYSALIGGIVGSIANIGDSIKAGREITPKEAAKEAAEQTAAEVEKSLSGGTLAEPTTDTAEMENAEQGRQGQPGLEMEKELSRAERFEQRQAEYERRVAELENDTPTAEDIEWARNEQRALAEEYYIVQAEAEAERAGRSKAYGTEANHIDRRSAADVGKPGIKAFQFDHPEMHRYYVQAAQTLITDAQNSMESGGMAPATGTDNYGHRKSGMRYSAPKSSAIEEAARWDISRPQLIKALQDIIANHGQENYAAAKRVELILDKVLSDGYTTSYGESIAPNNDYIAAKSRIAGGQSEYARRKVQLDKTYSELDLIEGAPNEFELQRRAEEYDALDKKYGEGIYGKSVGAAAPAQGKMVPTQNKAITQNINLSEQSRAANQPAPHERITEAMSLARAGAMLYTDSEGNIIDYEATLDELMNKEGNWTGVESDAVQMLLKEAEKRGDAETVKRIAERMAKEGTDLGQALQARKKWIGSAPATRLAAMYQEVAQIAKDHKARHAKKGGKIEIPDFLAKAYLKAGSEVKRDEVISDIQEYVAKQVRSTLGEAWTALRYTNMLGNFKTQIRNILGNTTMAVTSRVRDEVAALGEALAGAVSGGKIGRTKSAFVGKEFMRAAKADFANAKKAILSIGKYSGENFKGDFAEGIESKRKLLPPGLEQYRRVTNLAMEGGDIIFSKGAYARSLAGFLKANGVSAEQLAAGSVDAELMDRSREYAIKQAQEATFRDSNAFSDWLSNAARGEKTPKAVKAIAEGIAPFRRTPANVLVRAVEYSPLGIVNTVAKSVQAAKGNATASDIIDALAKTVTGSGLVWLGYILADNDFLRGAGEEDEEEIDALMNRQDWSLKIPGVGSYTLDWASPASLIMFTGAVLSELASDEELTLADFEDAFTSLTEPLVQMSMLSGINDTLDSIKYSDNNLLQMAGTLAASYLTQGLTNTLVGQFERSTEANRMSSYTDPESPLPEWLQRTMGKASAKTPIWEYQQTEYLNEFGETESNGGVGQRILENFLSPGYWESSKEGETAYDFAEKMWERLGINAFPAAYSPDAVDYKGEKFTLTQEEKEEYQRTRGENAKDFMEYLAGSREFAATSKDDQREIISKALSYAQEDAKNDALRDKGVKVEKSDADKVIARMTPSQYIDWLISDVKAQVPANYKSSPDWQELEKALVLPGSLAIDMMIASNEKAGKRVNIAVQNGVDLERAVAYYRAATEKNAEGKTPTTAEKNQRLAALGFTYDERSILEKAFDTKIE